MKRILFTLILAASGLFPQANTEIMTEIGPGLGYNASVKQILHVGDLGGFTSTATAIYDADGTASALSVGTVNMTVTTGTSAGSDWIISNGTPMWTLQGDVVDAIWRGDSTAGSDFILEQLDGVDAFTFESDQVAFTLNGDGTADSDISFGDGSTEFFLLETDLGDITIADGAYDFDIASHDGTNGLMLGGTLVTTAAAELNSRAAITVATIDQSALYTVGRHYTDVNGNVFVYIQGVASTVAGDWLQFTVTSTTASTTTRAIANGKGPLGVAMGALIGGDFGWVQVAGLNLAAGAISGGDAAAGAVLYLTGTAGLLDDQFVDGDMVFGALWVVQEGETAGNPAALAGVWLAYPTTNDLDIVS